PRRTPRRPAPPPAAASSGGVSFHGVSLPADAFSRTDRIPDSLAAAIDATRRTLRVAVYELNLPGVADAIVRAQQRGVDVEVVYDWSHAQGLGGAGGQPGSFARPSPQLQQLLSAGVPVRFLRGSGPYGIMHNKFAVLDGELVETGSFNWTLAADQTNFENAVFRDDPSLASLFSSYFDWMWNLGAAPGAGAPSAGPFGTPPSDPSPTVAFKGASLPRATFSPDGGTGAALVDAISRCTMSLDVAIFSFYSPAVADAVVAAKDRGVAVRVVADVSQAQKSPQVARLINAGVPVRLSAGRGGRGVLHHKFAVLDGELVATGSYNFSVNAEKNNFENQLMSADPGDAAAFGAEFEAVWAQAHDPQPGEVQGANVSGSVALR
ncbi:MAG: hypothetical protein KGM24_04375, partial [Elusimicrobia bacterium]|nr:hypothetical protein [Elusimicrobiota bacterium]